MVTALIVLSILCALLAAGVVWLLLGQQRSVKYAAEAESARRRAEEEFARLASQTDTVSDELKHARDALGRAGQTIARLEEQHKAKAREVQAAEESFEQRLKERDERDRQARADFKQQLEQHLKSIAGEALGASSKQFLKLAEQTFERRETEAKTAFDERHKRVEQLVKPITDTLAKTDAKLAEIEKARLESFSALQERMKGLSDGSAELITQTRALKDALKKPHVRGAYGEVQLKRVAELAGMLEHCDFRMQDQVPGSDGRPLRPDCIVDLPGGRQIVIDAKTNIGPYLEALESDDAQQQATLLDRFASGMLDQAKKLAKKGYWSSYEGGADFVVMFVPGDQFVDAALERQPDLLELAYQHNIILASPSTLIGLLRAVHVGWREKDLSDRADELFKLGRELHERAGVLLGHMEKVGTNLEQAVRSYDKMVASADKRLLPTLRRFEDAGAKSGKPLAEPKPIEQTPSLPQIAEGS